VDNYTDVTQGLFAGWKKLARSKLVGNIKKAYVDVLSRQQSACNQQLLGAAESCDRALHLRSLPAASEMAS
jgi:hypothetical protein